MEQYLSSKWNIDDDDYDIIKFFFKWKTILDDDKNILLSNNQTLSNEKVDPYCQLVWNCWMPMVQDFIFKWNPRQSIDLINLISRWKVCLPQQIFEHIRDELIVPKLKLEISSFDPLSSERLTEQIIHTWEQLFGNDYIHQK